MAPMDDIEKVLRSKEQEIFTMWIQFQLKDEKKQANLISDKELQKESLNFLREFITAIKKGELIDIDAPDFEQVKSFLKNLSNSRALMGFSPTETAMYVFSLKQILHPLLIEVYRGDLERLNKEIIRINLLIDKLGLFTFAEYVKSRERVIREQAEAMLELSTPIVSLWDQILAIPIIGTLDSNRTQIIMENLLSKIVNSGSKIAVIDITGVGIMDTQVANHILKTVSAVKLLGAEAIITGIRPEVAQTIVNLGVDLREVLTRASLADGLVYAFEILKLRVVKGT